MKSSKTIQASAVAFAGLWFAASATAAPLVYFAEDVSSNQSVANTDSLKTRNVFLSSLIGVGNENFEAPGQVAGTKAPLTLNFPGALTASLAGAGCVDTTIGVIGQCDATAVNSNPGRWATSGTQFWEVSSGGGFEITFGTAISAFGFFGTDIGDFAGRLQVTLTDTNNVKTVLDINHTQNLGNESASLLFWGFIDTNVAYNKLSFSNTGANSDTFGFDDMVIGSREQIQPVPEPGSLALAGLALFGLLSAGRRRQR